MNVVSTFHVRAAAVALSTILLASCSPEQVVSGPNVVARWKACSESTDGLRNRGRTVLENHSWAERTLTVNVTDNDYCSGTRITNPAYVISGKLVQLSWGWERAPEKAITACTCDFAVRFELRDVPAGDYQVQLARVR
jgi:hypothetical protein